MPLGPKHYLQINMDVLICRLNMIGYQFTIDEMIMFYNISEYTHSDNFSTIDECMFERFMCDLANANGVCLEF